MSWTSITLLGDLTDGTSVPVTLWKKVVMVTVAPAPVGAAGVCQWSATSRCPV